MKYFISTSLVAPGAHARTPPAKFEEFKEVEEVKKVAAAPADSDLVVTAPKRVYPRWLLLTVDICASITTLTGLYFGSGTLTGACWYAISLIFWYSMTIMRKQWGLMPLNLATTVIVGMHLFRALQP